MNRPERKLVNKKEILVDIIDNPQEIAGIVHFPTEQQPNAVFPCSSTAKLKKHVVTYRRDNSYDDNEEEEVRKKEVEYHEVTISPNRMKEKQFKVEVPLIRGSKVAKTSHRVN